MRPQVRGPVNDPTLVNMLEVLYGVGVGVHAKPRNPSRAPGPAPDFSGGDPHGFAGAIGYPLATDAERRTLLAGAPDGTPRPCRW